MINSGDILTKVGYSKVINMNYLQFPDLHFLHGVWYIETVEYKFIKGCVIWNVYNITDQEQIDGYRYRVLRG